MLCVCSLPAGFCRYDGSRRFVWSLCSNLRYGHCSSHLSDRCLPWNLCSSRNHVTQSKSWTKRTHNCIYTNDNPRCCFESSQKMLFQAEWKLCICQHRMLRHQKSQRKTRKTTLPPSKKTCSSIYWRSALPMYIYKKGSKHHWEIGISSLRQL